jgi:hypothetical protein
MPSLLLILLRVLTLFSFPQITVIAHGVEEILLSIEGSLNKTPLYCKERYAALSPAPSLSPSLSPPSRSPHSPSLAPTALSLYSLEMAPPVTHQILMSLQKQIQNLKSLAIV